MRKSQENSYLYLGSIQAWLYLVVNHIPSKIKCGTEEHDTIYLQSTGILSLNSGCMAMDNKVIFDGPPLDRSITKLVTNKNYWRPHVVESSYQR